MYPSPSWGHQSPSLMAIMKGNNKKTVFSNNLAWLNLLGANALGSGLQFALTQTLIPTKQHNCASRCGQLDLCILSLSEVLHASLALYFYATLLGRSTCVSCLRKPALCDMLCLDTALQHAHAHSAESQCTQEFAGCRRPIQGKLRKARDTSTGYFQESPHLTASLTWNLRVCPCPPATAPRACPGHELHGENSDAL